MSDVNLATKSDLANLFQELEDAAKYAKKENKEKKIKTESQVKELDSFLTSVQEVVKVIDETPKEEPKVVEVADIVVEQPVIESPVIETKSLSTEDEDKLGAFAGLMSSFGAILDAPPEVEDTDTLKLQVEDIYPQPKPVVSEEKVNNQIEALQNLFSTLAQTPEPEQKVVEVKEEVVEEFEVPELTPLVIEKPNLVAVAKDTPIDITQALTEVKQRALPTKEQTVEATQELITNVISNLDDMKSKTNVKEQLSEIGTIRQEFDNFRSLVSQQIASSKMSGAGSGEVRLEFLDDVQRTTAKVDGKFLKYSSSDGKFIGADASPTTLEDVTAGTVAASKAVVVDSNKDITGFRNVTVGGNLTVQGTTTTIDSATINVVSSFVFEGATDNAHETTLTVTDPTADRTITIPDATDTLVGKATTDTLTNKTLTAPTITGTAVMADLDISGDVDVDGTLETDALSIDGTTISSTAAEINLIDGGTSRGTTAVATGDGILINDGGTMLMTNVDTVSTYFSSHNVGGGNIVTTGAVDSGSITSNFGTIDTGASTITTTGLISGGSLDVDNVLINGTTIGHTDDTDLMTVADGLLTVAGEVSMTTLDIGGTNVTATATELNYVDGVTSAIQTQLDTKTTAADALAAATAQSIALG